MKLALAFSGGKDSLASLYLHEADWSSMTVLWVNTGKNLPEVEKLVSTVRGRVRDFVEIKVDRDLQNRFEGLPSDVVPINWTPMGQACTTEKPITIQSYLSCCYENISAPLLTTARRLGVTHLIRGQRHDEGHKATSTHGSVVDGITFIHPVETWSREDVLSYLETKTDVPAHFYLGHTSIDCYDCSAYRKETVDVRNYIKVNHPEKSAEREARISRVDAAIHAAIF